MKPKDSSYHIAGVDVSNIRNRNESRMVKKLSEIMADMDCSSLSAQNVRDAYALALNLLPARYRQSGTIVLREPVRETHLHEAAVKALNQVLAQPKK